jgi:hypothetical protein
MAILGFLLNQFLTDRQRFESKCFEVFLTRVSLYPQYDWDAIAKSSIEAARAFDKAMDDATIGVEDLKIGLPH